ncbi:MAG: hypothetical protein M1829_002341 [Trizodia sp. TS-e1964]|nr:MAG: hypothetical protein M1829_002341 [Trizodia sp. TS-e1964]
MPSIKLHTRSDISLPSEVPNPLPKLLQTPAGLAILELQGTINLPDISNLDTESSSTDPSNEISEIGRLEFPCYSPLTSPQNKDWMKQVFLYVGPHQRLTGEIRKLANPMAVIQRRKTSQHPQAESDQLPEELEILEIITHKIIFSQRPEPVGE